MAFVSIWYRAALTASTFFGITDLAKELRPSKDRPHSISAFTGQVVCVDIAAWLFKSITTVAGGRAYHQTPHVPITTVTERLTSLDDCFTKYNVTPLYCIDGAANPLKAGESQRREATRATHQEEYSRLIAGDIPDDEDERVSFFKKLDKARVGSASVRGDMRGDCVRFLTGRGRRVIQGVLEAEHQGAACELFGLAAALVSDDSDGFALGIITQIWNLHDDGSCVITRRQELLLKEKLGAGLWTEDQIRILCTALGNDYLPRPKNQGWKVATAMTNSWYTSTPADLEASLSAINQKSFGKEHGGGPCTGYSDAFKTVVAFFKHVPVYQEFQDEHGTMSVRIVPLTPFSDGEDWLSTIGFDPATCLPPHIPLMEYYNSHVWARTGEPFPSVEPVKVDGVVVPHGSVLDFSVLRPEFVPHEHLVHWLQCRLLPPATNATHSDVVAAVKGVLALGDGGPSIQPASAQIGPAGYNAFETLQTRGGDSSVTWVSGPDVLRAMRERVSPISKQMLNDFFVPKMPGLRSRALMRFLSGSLRADTVSFAVFEQRGSGEEAYVFKLVCTPSMKKEVYPIRMAFDVNGRYMASPASSCGCPDGLLFCSHMLAFLLLVFLAQRYPEMDWSSFQRILPEPIRSIQELIIPFSYMFPLGGTRMQLKNLHKELVDSERAASPGESPAAHGGELETGDDDTINLCEQVEIYAETRFEAARLQGHARAEPPVTASGIKAASANAFAARKGATSPQSQRRIDLRHEALHLAYERGALPKDQLSYYLQFWVDDRRARLTEPLEPEEEDDREMDEVASQSPSETEGSSNEGGIESDRDSESESTSQAPRDSGDSSAESDFDVEEGDLSPSCAIA